MPSLALRAGMALTSATRQSANQSSRLRPAARSGADCPARSSEALRSVQRRAALVSAGVCAARCGTLYAAALELARSEVPFRRSNQLPSAVVLQFATGGTLDPASLLAMPWCN